MLEEQQGEHGWELAIRVFAVSSDADVAVRRAAKVAGMYRNFYESNTEQTFEPHPQTGDDLRTLVDTAARREWEDVGMVKTQLELAGLVNVPKAKDVNTNKMQWSMSKPGEGVPPGTPRYDFDAAGIESEATRKERQVTMLEEPGDDVFWLGFGSRNGTEVGVHERYLNAHMQVTGGTRKGKTNTLTQIGEQIMERGHGALVIVNGKESDDERFVEAWPEDRPEEDFVFIDTGDEFEKRVRFNLLELPTDADPGTVEFSTAVEALADDWSASFAQAGGGSDNYWGALMNRLTRTIIRGMEESGKTCTPLDLAAACSSAEGVGRFKEWMDQERIHFVREAAERLAEKEDADLEPLAGRMDMLTQHAGMRNFLCARNPTASIQDFVREGKVCVLRIDPSLGETETKFMLTPIVRRFYTAKRTLPDAPRFYLIWDEFDKCVSPLTNIHEMLSIAGGHDFRMILACQAPSNQLYDRLKKAMQNQIDTAVSFGTGKEDARYVASHHTLDADELAGIGRYKFWLRTYYQRGADEDKTYSYKVDAFPPSREVRQEVLGDETVTDRDVARMKRESVERYGDVPESAEQLKAESHFYDEVQAPTDGEGSDGVGDIDGTLDDVLAAAFALTVREDEGDTIDTGALVTLVKSNTNLPYNHADTLVQRANARELVTLSPDGSTAALTPEGRERLFDSGKAGSTGGIGHQAPMECIARTCDEMGYVVDIPVQDGGELPDLLGTLPLSVGGATFTEAQRNRDRLKDDYPAVFDLSADGELAIEFEKGTVDRPAQIGANLHKAIEASPPRHVLFVVSPGEDDYTAVADKLARKLSEPVLTYENPPSDVSRRFHRNGALSRSGQQIALPGETHQWVDPGDGSVVLRNAEGTVYARFTTHKAFEDAGVEDFPAAFDDVPDDYTAVSTPFVPEWEFETLPTPDQWDIAILPTERGEPLQWFDPETGQTFPLPDRHRTGVGASGSTGKGSVVEGTHEEASDEANSDLWSDL
ncbi:hypothetical protein [Halegenticoccus tardaugens]|uniref:hypothetical protein n=1 Tax=Halegenticoccus tardaugens TaxID=2071624 RepID=UPI0013E96BA3|nr:hypothetical protein [Halegenticoccus tardaugens]